MVSTYWHPKLSWKLFGLHNEWILFSHQQPLHFALSLFEHRVRTFFSLFHFVWDLVSQMFLNCELLSTSNIANDSPLIAGRWLATTRHQYSSHGQAFTNRFLSLSLFRPSADSPGPRPFTRAKNLVLIYELQFRTIKWPPARSYRGELLL